jgi:hypothetical protein
MNVATEISKGVVETVDGMKPNEMRRPLSLVGLKTSVSAHLPRGQVGWK